MPPAARLIRRSLKDGDAHPRQRLGAAQRGDQCVDGSIRFAVDVHPRLGPRAEEIFEQRNRGLAVDKGLRDLRPRQLADLSRTAASSAADRCRGTPPARRRRSPVRRSRDSDSRGRPHIRTPAWCSPAHRWRRLDGRTRAVRPSRGTDDEGCSYGKYRRSTWLTRSQFARPSTTRSSARFRPRPKTTSPRRSRSPRRP